LDQKVSGRKRSTEVDGSGVRVGRTRGVSVTEGAGGDVSATDGVLLGLGCAGSEADSDLASLLNHCQRLAWKAVVVIVIGSGALLHPEPTVSEYPSSDSESWDTAEFSRTRYTDPRMRIAQETRSIASWPELVDTGEKGCML
jgi:hypothetical protein